MHLAHGAELNFPQDRAGTGSLFLFRGTAAGGPLSSVSQCLN